MCVLENRAILPAFNVGAVGDVHIPGGGFLRRHLSQFHKVPIGVAPLGAFQQCWGSPVPDVET